MKRPFYYGVYFYTGDISIYGVCTYGYSRYEALNRVLNDDEHREDIIKAIEKATRLEVCEL